MNSYTIKLIGKIILAIGLLTFIGGILMLFLSAFSPAFIVIIISIILNIVGITMATTKATK